MATAQDRIEEQIRRLSCIWDGNGGGEKPLSPATCRAWDMPKWEHCRQMEKPKEATRASLGEQ